MAFFLQRFYLCEWKTTTTTCCGDIVDENKIEIFVEMFMGKIVYSRYYK